MVGQESQLRAMIMVNMGGRVAETLKYGEVSAGASGDIANATGTATRMVTAFGMSKALGPVALGGEGGGMPFVGAHMGGGSSGPGEKTREKIDNEVKSIITEAETESLNLLTEYRPVLEATAKLLMEKETIDGEEIDPFIDECEKSAQ
jgi:cell division protease FtsH